MAVPLIVALLVTVTVAIVAVAGVIIDRHAGGDGVDAGGDPIQDTHASGDLR